ncbi:4-hydroxybenzoyl-CoA reductase subunit beta [Rhodopseudomonas pseudopalustris]|uniref:4-hydroxybenzoyl-CoA reductase beta subunit n=1 Tax=Rhodopseudomonas pseudopalustris TaxID=1513892 RepID=A0A1H8UIZ6_9BRAD|nr:4-hydroxybenzoyl-CoA reductase subunit beta [Rhodopseudomonas pseudopalustris]SEP02933.1 4-hydroxybenzoyl-CoA reductase beta subunit [Rhodopseudomonas pseudopalustris]
MTDALHSLRLLQPGSIDEAVAALAQHPDARLVAGGTDLLVNIRRGVRQPDLLIDAANIAELKQLSVDGDALIIGAGVTIAALADDALIASRYRALAQAAASIAGPGHRRLGTVGGNLCLDTRCIYYNQSEWWRRANAYCLKNHGETCHVAPKGNRCHAAFSGDLAPALLVLGAEIDVAGPGGSRRIPLAELYVEDGKAHLALKPGELVVKVRLPANPAASAYQKLRVRGAVDYPLAGVAVALARSGADIAQLRIALTGTNSRPFLLAGTDALAQRPLDDQMLKEIDQLVQQQVQPMRTTLMSSNYRRLAAAAIARRLTGELFAA